LTAAECVEGVEQFLARHPEFSPEPPPPSWALPAASECLDPQGRLFTPTHRTGTDGFFAVRLRRAALRAPVGSG
jgi:16S rRNA C967 or C1407 C5-methylase (RsmB/RsmF family)